jgi:hypothetical protein
MLETIITMPPGAPLPDTTRKQAQSVFMDTAEMCRAEGFTASTASAHKLVNLLSMSEPTYAKVRELAIELQERIIDELSAPRFLALSDQEVDRYEHWEKNWERILIRFPDTTRDVEEANKCIALGRYTAAMFHALHVAEWGAIALGDYIGVTDPTKGWGPTKKKLEELIKLGHSQLPNALVGKFEFLEQMHREIESMMLAWRHKVDHAANYLAIVPNTDFTPDVAEHIIGSVRVFMLRLVEGVPA